MISRMLHSRLPALMILIITILACNMPGGTTEIVQPPPAAEPSTPAPEQLVAAETPTIAVQHAMIPGEALPGKIVYDVESEGTAPERRAPYGDSYNINRLERPFLQDMTYVPDLDIVTYVVGQDGDWWYVTIQLIGSDPNNAMGIHYAVELDLDSDGFGDYIIWAQPPYTTTWDTLPVKIYQDKNHNTSGISSVKSDAPIETDGYESLIFDGAVNQENPDAAFVRYATGIDAAVQFAFKKSWSGSVFMLGVLADAGLKDVQKLDYVDRFKEEEAGSPVKDKVYYPLKALFAVDNACREAFGFSATGFEPQLCPREEPTPKPRSTEPSGCQPPPEGCGSNSFWYAEPFCLCSPF
jgi:hypothetical protein